MLFFRSYFFKGSETDLNKLVQKQLALNSTRVTLESFQPIISTKLRKKKESSAEVLYELEILLCPC